MGEARNEPSHKTAPTNPKHCFGHTTKILHAQKAHIAAPLEATKNAFLFDPCSGNTGQPHAKMRTEPIHSLLLKRHRAGMCGLIAKLVVWYVVSKADSKAHQRLSTSSADTDLIGDQVCAWHVMDMCMGMCVAMTSSLSISLATSRVI